MSRLARRKARKGEAVQQVKNIKNVCVALKYRKKKEITFDSPEVRAQLKIHLLLQKYMYLLHLNMEQFSFPQM